MEIELRHLRPGDEFDVAIGEETKHGTLLKQGVGSSLVSWDAVPERVAFERDDGGEGKKRIEFTAIPRERQRISGSTLVRPYLAGDDLPFGPDDCSEWRAPRIVTEIIDGDRAEALADGLAAVGIDASIRHTEAHTYEILVDPEDAGRARQVCGVSDEAWR